MTLRHNDNTSGELSSFFIITDFFKVNINMNIFVISVVLTLKSGTCRSCRDSVFPLLIMTFQSDYRESLLLQQRFPVSVSSHQKWIEKPQSVQAFQGENAVISCKVRNKVGHCSWRKNGRLVYLYPGKYSWAGQPSQGDCSLRITDVAAQFDSGHWQCSVTASSYLGRLYLRDTLDSEPVLLTILYPPSHAAIRVANDVSGQVVGVAGKSLEVECLGYGGFPPPEITWHLEGDLQPADTSSLDSFTDMDTGLEVTRSTITLNITRQDHNKVLSCELLHPALGLPLWVKAMINVGCMWSIQYRAVK